MNIKNILTVVITIVTVQLANAQSSTMKEPVSFKLSNGLTVIVAENKNVTKVHSSLTNDIVNDNQAGVQHVLTAMLNHATGNSGINYNENGGHLMASTADFGDALSVLSASIQVPTLNQAIFEKAKATVIASVKGKKQYYQAHVTEASLEKLTLKDVKAFYNSNITPAKTYLTIAGNISVVEAKNLAEKSFASWSETQTEALNSK